MLKPVPSIIAALAVALVTVSSAARDHRRQHRRRRSPVRRRARRRRVRGVLRRADRADRLRDRRPLRRRRHVASPSASTRSWEPAGLSPTEPLEVDPARRADLAVVVLDAPAAVVPAAPAGRGNGRVARPEDARDERRLRLLGLGRGRKLRLRRLPPRGELAREEGRPVDDHGLDEVRRALPRRLRRAAALGKHGALRSPPAAPRTAPARPRATASTRRRRAPSSRELRLASVTPGRAAPFQ